MVVTVALLFSNSFYFLPRFKLCFVYIKANSGNVYCIAVIVAFVVAAAHAIATVDIVIGFVSSYSYWRRQLLFHRTMP